MDVDAFSAAHRDQWDRLDQLVSRRRLSGQEADELVALYRSCARHLSRVRTTAPDPQLAADLSRRLASARGRLTGTRELSLGDAMRFLSTTMPAALYRIRWWTIGVTMAEIAIAVIVGVWTLRTPEAMSALGTPQELEQYASKSFEAYYSTYEAPDFAAQVWTNNARIAALCVASGITGVLPLYILFQNAALLGSAGAVMADHGAFPQFLALISPHGLLELTCVFIAGAAGLRLFWTLLVPGPRSRGAALAAEGRALITVAVFLTGALALAGLIEAFVTPAPMPWAVKITIGVLALAALWAYTLLLGRRAAARGHTGDLGEEEAGYTLPEAG
ncbi:stage II sporulation protein M [Actinomyces bowdenii]|uniref:Stage II sporulation protein M n=1 Tax=Actinomyces bowdenii TaxID=131109 RepID=A0A3P1URD1_9ACTO|nr:stage II sporulation protein M [Actinomyces bowdenii]RRD24439.1 stage II sporulation protein M [Actinomyces bowdenii]